MPFLDLDDELALLGYSAEADPREWLDLSVITPWNHESRLAIVRAAKERYLAKMRKQRKQGRADFVKALELFGLTGTAQSIAIGRLVQDDNLNPDLVALASGRTPDVRAARIDLWFHLAKGRGWTVDEIAALGGWRNDMIRAGLAERGLTL